MLQKKKRSKISYIHINAHIHMVWFDSSTYVFRVIVVSPIGSHRLTYNIATKHGSKRLPHALKASDKKQYSQTYCSI